VTASGTHLVENSLPKLRVEVPGLLCAAGSIRHPRSVSRRRKHPPATQLPTVTANNEDFSDQELDFFKRGDEPETCAGDTSDAPDSDA
jgi:hypothetical protein